MEVDSDGSTLADDVYKIMVLGDGGVGKSALTLQLVNNCFEEAWDPTVEDSYKKTVMIDGKTCHLDILDTSGQDEFLAMREANMRYRDAFLLVFAVDNRRTSETLQLEMQRLQRVKDNELPVVVVAANKCDLTRREVDFETASQLARQWNAPCIETSAKTREGVDRAFHTLVKLLIDKRKEQHLADNRRKKSATGSNASKGCCTIL